MGSALALAAGAFVLARLWTQSAALPPGALFDAWPKVMLGAILYAAAGSLLALAWWLALRVSGASSVAPERAIAAHLASQIGKYLPGNVGHFAARHAFGRSHGVSHPSLLAATMVETVVLMTAAGAFALLVIDRLFALPMLAALPLPTTLPIWIAPLLALLLLPAGLLLGRRCGWIAGDLGNIRRVLEVFIALLLGMLFFVACAGIFLLISSSLDGTHWLQLLPWLTAAWLLGFVLPGAPGGLGIRELVLASGLASISGEASAALDAVLFRLVTVAGDVLMSAAGGLVLSRSQQNQQPACDATSAEGARSRSQSKHS